MGTENIQLFQLGVGMECTSLSRLWC